MGDGERLEASIILGLMSRSRTNKRTFIRSQGLKPWRYTGIEDSMQREDIKMLVKKWWAIYEDKSLDYKKPRTQEESEKSMEVQPLVAVLQEAPELGKFMTAPS
ncbi:hypothetical protein MLD38_026332 [Melastoma candidum]|uniref:Uncharacterized protein n=1 Tax=Melastoma candidum TaxID=119954 RepID=A0ACB9P1R6_9MYRT|nr:hypothetical protein MLD38_026332 [Melastoma candidum]